MVTEPPEGLQFWLILPDHDEYTWRLPKAHSYFKEGVLEPHKLGQYSADGGFISEIWGKSHFLMPLILPPCQLEQT